MSLEAHLEILRACLVSVVWTWGSRLREVLVSATVTIYLFSLSTHWRTAADAKEAEEPTTNAQSKGNYVFVTRVGSMTYIFCVFYIRLPPGSSGRGGGGDWPWHGPTLATCRKNKILALLEQRNFDTAYVKW